MTIRWLKNGETGFVSLLFFGIFSIPSCSSDCVCQLGPIPVTALPRRSSHLRADLSAVVVPAAPPQRRLVRDRYLYESVPQDASSRALVSLPQDSS